MIVNKNESGWEIIFQRNHALLAGAIANEIQEAFRPPYWIETLSAILEHDDGQSDWSENNHITSQGEPKDFTEYGFDEIQAYRVLEEAKYKSKWIRLLVSMHTSSLYENVKDKSKKLICFLNKQDRLQQELLDEFSISKTQVEKYYGFLRWCDECSLILCQNRIQQNSEKIEIGKLNGNNPNFIINPNEKVIEVYPWCFEANHFKVSAEVYCIDQSTFKSSAELKRKIETTQPENRIWEFKKSNNL